MTKVRVAGFTLSLDGYGAGPDQGRDQPSDAAASACTNGSSPPAPFGRCAGKPAERPGSTRISLTAP